MYQLVTNRKTGTTLHISSREKLIVYHQRIGCKMSEEPEEQKEKSRSPRDQESASCPSLEPTNPCDCRCSCHCCETHSLHLIRSLGVNPIDAAETNTKAGACSHCQKWENSFFLYKPISLRPPGAHP